VSKANVLPFIGIAAASLLLYAGTGSTPTPANPTAPRAGDHRLSLLVTPAGCYELSLDASGAPLLKPLGTHYDQVIILGEPGPGPTPPVPPNPQPTPPPVPLNARATLLRDAANKAIGLDSDRINTAQGLSMVLTELAKAAPTVKDPASLQTALTMGMDAVLSRQNAAAAWKPFRDSLAAQWAAVAVKGGSVADYGALLTDAANGVDATIPATTPRQIDPAFWQFLMDLLKILLPLLIPH